MNRIEQIEWDPPLKLFGSLMSAHVGMYCFALFGTGDELVYMDNDSAQANTEANDLIEKYKCDS